eukprot:TRINITY_DN60833_c0_g1_i1.p1 TRINITY_DN60833_c0_g1~~TRINITY_DN60833_c0_g1_i1.p1  ORF type:complete len:234 (+),score=34.79 TRINITY_DN60833_c0_g1_i1:73-774(+)
MTTNHAASSSESKCHLASLIRNSGQMLQASSADARFDSVRRRHKRRQRLHNVHCYVAKTGADLFYGVAASAALLDECLANSAADLPPLQGESRRAYNCFHHWLSLFVGAVSSLRDAAIALVEAIGRPPRQPLTDQDPPALLLYAFELGLVFVVFSMLFFVFAFFSDNSGHLSDEIPESSLADLQRAVYATLADRLCVFFRLAFIMLVSGLSGASLGFLRNSIHSVCSVAFVGI